MLRLLFLLLLFTTISNSAKAQFVIVDSVIFKGNEKTRDNILRRELDLHSGDTLQVSELDARLEFNRRKLNNTNLFIWVKGDYHQNKPEHIEITYEFLEQWYLLGYPIFQLADRNLNEWWSKGHSFSRTIYGAHLIHNNFRGRNERLSFKAETGFTQRLELGYSNPYIDPKKTLGIGAALSYTTNKNLAVRTRNDTLQILSSDKILRERWSGALSFRKRIKFYDFHFAEMRYSHSVVSDTIRLLNPNYYYKGSNEQNFLQLTYAYSYDFRDYAPYPLRGKKLDFAYNYFGILAQDALNYWDLRASISYFFDLGSNFFITTSWKGKLTQENRNIPYANLQALGYGNDNVRGYELNVIDGTNYLLSKNTFKYQLYNKVIPIRFIPYKQFNQVPIAVYPTVFFDFAYVYQASPELTNSRFSNRWIYGMGLGFDIVTYYNFVCKLGVPVINSGKSGLVVSIGREF
ncbi:BamA/TamA family outer membrane protein [Aquirufa novilacunae]|jgi:outer membrane protein assembly factor BamA|uniref:BamA/TamA family outer membrane protein n=1 Tax=Aquirufa novilacunae TaxID=3139305 RepID=A0ABW8ST98_9BACT